MISRRSFLTSITASAIAAPFVIRNPSILMPARNRLKMVPFGFSPAQRALIDIRGLQAIFEAQADLIAYGTSFTWFDRDGTVSRIPPQDWLIA